MSHNRRYNNLVKSPAIPPIHASTFSNMGGEKSPAIHTGGAFSNTGWKSPFFNMGQSPFHGQQKEMPAAYESVKFQRQIIVRFKDDTVPDNWLKVDWKRTDNDWIATLPVSALQELKKDISVYKAEFY